MPHPQALQAEGAWRDAERHFCEAKEWRAAVNMHSAQAAWDDALRVAKVFGGPGAASEVHSTKTHPCVNDRATLVLLFSAVTDVSKKSMLACALAAWLHTGCICMGHHAAV